MAHRNRVEKRSSGFVAILKDKREDGGGAIVDLPVYKLARLGPAMISCIVECSRDYRVSGRKRLTYRVLLFKAQQKALDLS